MPSQPSGISQLDRVLGGGFPAGDLVLVMGAAGSGKTTLALQMAFHAAAREEVACFVATTSESPKRLLEHARTYRFYDEEEVGRRLFLLNVFPLLGLHTVRIDHCGIQLFPRFEALAGAADAKLPQGRRASGLPELDAMVSGGLPGGSITALAGAVGTGKTLLSLQFLLEGAHRGEPGLLVSLRETEAEMIAKARGFGFDLETPIRSGRIRFVRHSPVDLVVDEAMKALVDELDGGVVERLALDGILELLEPIPEEARRRALMHVLADQLRSRGVTAMIPVPVSQAVGPELDLGRTPMAMLAHNLLLMRNVEYQGELHRILSILKVRDSDFDASIRRYMITSEGLRILAPGDTAEGLLSGISGLASEARVKRPAGPEGER